MIVPEKCKYLYTYNINIATLAILVLKMEALSKKEVEVISRLEFDRKYFFTREVITGFFQNDQQISDFIFGLKEKRRIVKINKRKYYLIPIKAKSGGWSEDPFIIADEICDGKDYFIGGYASANYWKLTDQIPMQFDVYTTRRQGKVKIMNTRFVFHRTTKKRVKDVFIGNISGHDFRIMDKEDAKKWIKGKQ